MSNNLTLAEQLAPLRDALSILEPYEAKKRSVPDAADMERADADFVKCKKCGEALKRKNISRHMRRVHEKRRSSNRGTAKRGGAAVAHSKKRRRKNRQFKLKWKRRDASSIYALSNSRGSGGQRSDAWRKINQSGYHDGATVAGSDLRKVTR